MTGDTSAVEAFRTRYRETQIGPRYRGWLHFAFTSIASLAVVLFAISRVHAPSWAELSAVPLSFVLANAAEYFGHKLAMHVPRKGLGLVYRRHTREHHCFFTADAMSYASARDFKMVLFPPVMIVFFLGAIATPVGLVLFVAASRDVAWLFVATAMSYFLTYEWLHFAYHLPPETAVGRSRVIAALRRHHRSHHDLARMGRYNFNITFPICDVLFGTTFREDRQR